jgi:hypothetical protein
VFDEFMGIPAHPLLVHAAVVFVPLLIVAAAVYALVPVVRRWIAWAVVGLAVVSPFAVWVATLSGNALRERLAQQGASPDILAWIDEHRDFGDATLWATILLSVLTLLMVGSVVAKGRRPAAADGPAGHAAPRSGRPALIVTIVLAIAVLGAAGAGGYYVFKTGDSGARAVWGF